MACRQADEAGWSGFKYQGLFLSRHYWGFRLFIIEHKGGIGVITNECIWVSSRKFDIEVCAFVAFQAWRALLWIALLFSFPWPGLLLSGSESAEGVFISSKLVFDYDLFETQWWCIDDRINSRCLSFKVSFNVTLSYTVLQWSDLSQSASEFEKLVTLGCWVQLVMKLTASVKDFRCHIYIQLVIQDVAVRIESASSDLLDESQRQAREIIIELAGLGMKKWESQMVALSYIPLLFYVVMPR